MAMKLNTTARNRAAEAIVQPISGADGTLRLRQDDTIIVSFTPVRFPNPASQGSVTSAPINPADAVAAGIVNNWQLLDVLASEIASGEAGQRYGILSLDRGPSTVKVAGNRTSVFAARSNVTLHNRNDVTQNVYVTVDNQGSTYDNVTDTTTIYIFENLNAPPYNALNWTHIHLGELGMDNANIAVDQRVSIDQFTITVK